MPSIPTIDPTLASAKESLASKYLRSPAQSFTPQFSGEVQIPLVTGIAIGLPSVLNKNAPAQQILIFVEDASDCQLAGLYKEFIGAVPAGSLTVLRSGRFLGQQGPPPPAPGTPGSSISVYAPLQFNVPQVTAGTYGAVAQDSSGAHYILGSNHVMAYNGRAHHGSPIVAPGTLDDSITFEIVGSLTRFTKLHPAAWPVTQQQTAPDNTVDCALAELTAAGRARLGNLPPAIAPAIPTMTDVHKTGRTTGRTEGSICILDWEGFIDLSFGAFYFKHLIGVLGKSGAFAAPGDSGAAVIDDASEAPVGMVMARVYASGGFLPGAPLAGPFMGYIVLMCSMVDACNQLEVTSIIPMP